MTQEETAKRTASARQLHKQGCNCCQAVVMAFADHMPQDITTETLMHLTNPFGRGISGLKETCGCVTGMAIVCGLTGHEAKMKDLGNEFKSINGELNCARLLQIQGTHHSCNDLVACAAKLLAEKL